VAVLGLRILGSFDTLENGALDLAMYLRGEEALDDAHKVAVVAIDERTLRETRLRWPWPRAKLAQLVRAIRAAGAEVIALDLVLPEPSHVPEDCECEPARVCAVPGAEPTDCLLDAEDCDFAEVIAEGDDTVLGYFLLEKSVLEDGSLENRSNEVRLPTESLDADRMLHFEVPEGTVFSSVESRPEIEASLACFHRGVAFEGFVTHPRRRGAFRSYYLVQRLGDRKDIRPEDPYLPALALAAVARVWGGALRLEPDWSELPEVWVGSRKIPADALGTLVIDYLGPQGTIPTVSAVDLLQDSSSTQPPALAGGLEGKLDGALVFVGLEAAGLGDAHPTPFDELTPGVEIHATVAYNLLAERFVWRGALLGFFSLLAILLMGPWVAFFCSLRHYLVGAALAIGLVAVAWPAVAFGVFLLWRSQLDFVAPMAAGLVSLVATLWYQIHLGSRFEGYVSPNVRQALRSSPQIAETRAAELTVLFTDIRGFSTRTEEMDSDRVVGLLNDFFTPMTRVVLEQDGTLDKYMGDALMAFFGAPVALPDHARRACRAALAMRRELHAIRRMRPEMEGLDIGVGLNTGKMTVGDMGSRGLFDYTVIGQNVNLGQRLEAATKPEAFGVPILVSEATREQAGEGFLFRKVARLRAKGFVHPVTLHELVVERPEPGREPPGWSQPDEARLDLVRRFEQAYDLYFPGRDFVAAEEAFGALVEQHPDDRPCHYYLERCRSFRTQPPPADWDGVEEQTKK